MTTAAAHVKGRTVSAPRTTEDAPRATAAGHRTATGVRTTGHILHNSGVQPQCRRQTGESNRDNLSKRKEHRNET